MIDAKDVGKNINGVDEVTGQSEAIQKAEEEQGNQPKKTEGTENNSPASKTNAELDEINRRKEDIVNQLIRGKESKVLEKVLDANGNVDEKKRTEYLKDKSLETLLENFADFQLAEAEKPQSDSLQNLPEEKMMGEGVPEPDLGERWTGKNGLLAQAMKVNLQKKISDEVMEEYRKEAVSGISGKDLKNLDEQQRETLEESYIAQNLDEIHPEIEKRFLEQFAEKMAKLKEMPLDEAIEEATGIKSDSEEMEKVKDKLVVSILKSVAGGVANWTKEYIISSMKEMSLDEFLNFILNPTQVERMGAGTSGLEQQKPENTISVEEFKLKMKNAMSSVEFMEGMRRAYFDENGSKGKGMIGGANGFPEPEQGRLLFAAAINRNDKEAQRKIMRQFLKDLTESTKNKERWLLAREYIAKALFPDRQNKELHNDIYKEFVLMKENVSEFREYFGSSSEQNVQNGQASSGTQAAVA